MQTIVEKRLPSLANLALPHVCRFVRLYSSAPSAELYGNGPDGRSTIRLLGKVYPVDEYTNVTPSIAALTRRQLLKEQNNPLAITKKLIESNFPASEYTVFDPPAPPVSVYENFDSLNFAADHPGRSKSDTYYLNSDLVLRTHTSAHQGHCFRTIPTPGFLISADVYRRDEIDRSHYPVFHQMEGAYSWNKDLFKSEAELIEKIEKDTEQIPLTGIEITDRRTQFHDGNPKQASQSPELAVALSNHLKRTLEMVVGGIFSTISNLDTVSERTSQDPLQIRWIDAYFPFTAPSWEMEVYWNGDWLEIFGSGVTEKPVFDMAGVGSHVGWAFGLGLERLAMLLFDIPDIRLFWSLDPRFTSQFVAGKISRFQQFSKYPSTSRDVSFWLPQSLSADAFYDNDVMDIVRDVAGDLVEDVKVIDRFSHPKTGKHSLCYRIVYQSMERTLVNDEINRLQDNIRQRIVDTFQVELR
ncbi:mitochondrial phenylalanyl-tRNA synthetase [Lipomyces oligophaga]|uniref:mitochondrial phenylalanyl-tRNA synthetase n=1 Tax=Lipomyces oligophaga TaxID=45792 RepID=UPI0034CDD62A